MNSLRTEASPVGGYFGLELTGSGTTYHADALELNLGRNALELILRHLGCAKVYIPRYICDAVLEPIDKLGMTPVYYGIDMNLDPVLNEPLSAGSAFLYANYFGLKGQAARALAQSIQIPFILDNTQAFFDPPLVGAFTFYSARKFFGVPDGAYLYGDKVADAPLEPDTSFDRCEHLLRSIDQGSMAGFAAFQKMEASLSLVPPRRMSALTRRLLGGVEYGRVSALRRDHYARLDGALGGINPLRMGLSEAAVPLCYPLLVDHGAALRAELILRRIFVPTFWPGVAERVPEGSVEARLARDLLCLPLDQRYSLGEIDRVASSVLSLVHRE